MTEIDPNDLRFQFDVIRGQSESIRSLTEAMLNQQTTLGDIVSRLVRIEANKVDSRVTSLEAEVEQLKVERNQRAGMTKMLEWIFKSPLIGWLAAAGAGVWMVLHGKGPQ